MTFEGEDLTDDEVMMTGLSGSRPNGMEERDQCSPALRGEQKKKIAQFFLLTPLVRQCFSAESSYPMMSTDTAVREIDVYVSEICTAF